MSNQRIKNLIKVWWEKSGRESDQFSKFLFLWICFNAWLAHESGEEFDKDMINWLKRQNLSSSTLVASFEQCKNKSTFVDSLRFLKSNSPYKDSRGRRQDITIADENNLGEIVEAIYRIRCNLFHGGNGAHETEIQRQIALSNIILNEWVATLIVKLMGK